MISKPRRQAALAAAILAGLWSAVADARAQTYSAHGHRFYDADAAAGVDKAHDELLRCELQSNVNAYRMLTATFRAFRDRQVRLIERGLPDSARELVEIRSDIENLAAARDDLRHPDRPYHRWLDLCVKLPDEQHGLLMEDADVAKAVRRDVAEIDGAVKACARQVHAAPLQRLLALARELERLAETDAQVPPPGPPPPRDYDIRKMSEMEFRGLWFSYNERARKYEAAVERMRARRGDAARIRAFAGRLDASSERAFAKCPKNQAAGHQIYAPCRASRYANDFCIYKVTDRELARRLTPMLVPLGWADEACDLETWRSVRQSLVLAAPHSPSDQAVVDEIRSRLPDEPAIKEKWAGQWCGQYILTKAFDFTTRHKYVVDLALPCPGSAIEPVAGKGELLWCRAREKFYSRVVKMEVERILSAIRTIYDSCDRAAHARARQELHTAYDRTDNRSVAHLQARRDQIWQEYRPKNIDSMMSADRSTLTRLESRIGEASFDLKCGAK